MVLAFVRKFISVEIDICFSKAKLYLFLKQNDIVAPKYFLMVECLFSFRILLIIAKILIAQITSLKS